MFLKKALKNIDKVAAPELEEERKERDKLSNYVSPGHKAASYTPKLNTMLRILPPKQKKQGTKGTLINQKLDKSF